MSAVNRIVWQADGYRIVTKGRCLGSAGSPIGTFTTGGNLFLERAQADAMGTISWMPCHDATHYAEALLRIVLEHDGHDARLA